MSSGLHSVVQPMTTIQVQPTLRNQIENTTSPATVCTPFERYSAVYRLNAALAFGEAKVAYLLRRNFAALPRTIDQYSQAAVGSGRSSSNRSSCAPAPAEVDSKSS